MKPNSRDYFAELYVAGILGDSGWSIYFPKRDVGFDFIISKSTDSGVVLRPVQVKGKYPSAEKGDKTLYGYIGRLSQVHPDMVLAIPFFPTDKLGVAPVCTAYVPFWRISKQASHGWACQPASLTSGIAVPRRSYRHFFDAEGIAAIELLSWSQRKANAEDT
jgi:hypothetical protein